MNNLFAFVIIFFVAMLSSCIPVKKLKLFQDRGEVQLDKNGFIKLDRTEYRLSVNDVININISTNDDDTSVKMFGRNLGGKENNITVTEGNIYLEGVSIDIEGKIDLPVIGVIHVEGLTQREIKSILYKKLYSVFKENQFYVKVQLAGIPFSILGEVIREGRYRIYKNDINILEAIAHSGGFKVTADRENVIIQREYPEGFKTFTVDLTDNKTFNLPQFFIQPNDIILINPLRQKTWGTGTQGLSTFTTILTILSSSLNIYFLINRL